MQEETIVRIRVSGNVIQILGLNGYVLFQSRFEHPEDAEALSYWLVDTTAEMDWSAYEGTLCIYPHDERYPEEFQLKFPNEEARQHAFLILEQCLEINRSSDKRFITLGRGIEVIETEQGRKN